MPEYGRAMFFNGIEWDVYGNWGLPFEREFLRRVISASKFVSDKPVNFGRNYIINNSFESQQKIGFFDITTEGYIAEDGYLSKYCLHSPKSGNGRPNGFFSTPFSFGEGRGDSFPLGAWGELRFKVRAQKDKDFGLGVIGIIATSKGNTYSFELSEARRAPLGCGKWIEVSMRFRLSAISDTIASLDVQRYDWCYPLLGHEIEWEPDEKAESVAFIFYVNDADFWLDDVEFFFDKSDETKNSSIQAIPTLASVGEEVVVNYTVKNMDGSECDYPYTFVYNPLLLEALSETCGTIELLPYGEKTIKAKFKVLEGGAAIVTAFGAAGVPPVSTRISCKGRGFYFGDCHSHSNESDGKTTPYENLKRYYELGMSFNVSADHNVLPSDTSAWDDAVQKLRSCIPEPSRFLQIKATENSAGFNHAVQYFSEKRYDTPDTHDGWEEVIRKQKEDGGLTFIAHPFLKTNIQFWPILEGPKVILPQYKEADGFEIINSQTLDCTSETIEKTLEWWDRYNILGARRYYGIGNSDGHRTYELAGSYNALLLDELNEENIKTALANGNLFFTTGPHLRFSLGGADMGGEIKPSFGEKPLLKVTAYTENETPIERVVVYCYNIGEEVDELYETGRKNPLVLYEREYGKEDISLFEYCGEIEVKAGSFVRVEVYAERDTQKVMVNYQMAMSNPIWIVG